MKKKKEHNNGGFVRNKYNAVINWLSKHKSMALFFSHGGIHLLVLLICGALAIIFYCKVQNYNQRTMRQLSIRIEGDSLKNYLLTHMSFHYIIEMPSEVGRSPMEGFLCTFKYGQRDTTELQTLPYEIGPYGDCDVDAIQKMSIIMDDSTYVVAIPEPQEGFIPPEQLDRHHTSKLKGVVHHSKLYQTNYHYFTADDSIKEDEEEFHGPNLLNEWEDNNPYFSAFIGLHAIPGSYDLDSTSVVRIQYNLYPYKEGPNSYQNDNDFFEQAPMVIENVLPAPTEMTIENLIYRGKDVEKVFEQGGVYITACDPIKKAHADKMEFLFTVLIGTFIAFALDIIVQLILKWRKLKSKESV